MTFFSSKTITQFFRDHRVGSGLIFCLLILACGPQTGIETRSPRSEKTQASTLNINTATHEALQTLEGIGPKTADQIIRYRQEFGPFRRPAQLMLVEGIGEKEYLKVRSKIRIR